MYKTTVFLLTSTLVHLGYKMLKIWASVCLSVVVTKIGICNSNQTKPKFGSSSNTRYLRSYIYLVNDVPLNIQRKF